MAADAIWIASDLHLTAVADTVYDRFLHLLNDVRRDGARLILLGDLFEAYLGDDDDDPLPAAVGTELAALTSAGIKVELAHGNRDFLIGQAFAARCGARLLPELSRLDWCGRPLVLLHGDTLCSDDLAYQQIRVQLRSPQWQQQFLSQPLAQRRAFADQARAQSRAHTAMSAADIMDVNAAAVAALHASSGADWIIHGHTHRPAVHRDGSRRRIVLGDWPVAASWLRLGGDGSAELVHAGGREHP